MNKVILIGRLVKDPELSKASNDLSYCKFSLAVDRAYKNTTGEKVTDFINCVAWRVQAENLCKFMRKGNQIMVEGELQVRSYEDTAGNKKTVFEVCVNNIEFLGKSANETNTTNSNKIPPLKDINADDNPFEKYTPKTELSEDDLPF